MRVAYLALLLVATLATPSFGGSQWLHVRIVEDGWNREVTAVNLPLSAARRLVSTIAGADRIRVRCGDTDLDAASLRRLVRAASASPAGDWARVEIDSGEWDVALVSGVLRARRTDRSAEWSMPHAVAVALTRSGSERVDLHAGLMAMASRPEGGPLRIIDGKTVVTMWVDSVPGGR